MPTLQCRGPPAPDGMQECRLHTLTVAAGQREETWQRREDVSEGELYECQTTDVHTEIFAEFQKEYVWPQ